MSSNYSHCKLYIIWSRRNVFNKGRFFLSDVFINDEKAGQKSTIMLSMLGDGKLEGAENIWEEI